MPSTSFKLNRLSLVIVDFQHPDYLTSYRISKYEMPSAAITAANAPKSLTVAKLFSFRSNPFFSKITIIFLKVSN
jgi:hypothetical protein